MRWKQIIWDWNGTVINDVALCLDIINGLLLKYEKPVLTLEKYHEVFDFPVKDYYRRIGFNFEETPFEVVGTEFMQQYWQRWNTCGLHVGVFELLQNLKEYQIPQTIISAAETRLVQAGIEHFKLTRIFDELLGLDHHYATSKEGLVVEFVDAAYALPSEILFIGDTLHDYHVAQNADVACILFAGGHHPADKLRQSGAPVFETFADLQEYIYLE